MNAILSMIVAALLWLVLKCFIPMLENGYALMTFIYAGFCVWAVCFCYALKRRMNKNERDKDN